jgi:hypothetical protein
VTDELMFVLKAMMGVGAVLFVLWIATSFRRP